MAPAVRAEPACGAEIDSIRFDLRRIRGIPLASFQNRSLAEIRTVLGAPGLQGAPRGAAATERTPNGPPCAAGAQGRAAGTGTDVHWLATCCGRGASALVRLRRREARAVEVRSCAVMSRAVSNRNCVAARRGGEHRNENDQSVTQTVRVGGRRELDSVGVDGRAFERRAKPVKRAIGGKPNRRTAGRSPVVAPMVGDGMAGRRPAIIRETRRGQAVFTAQRPEEPPGGSQSVRSSCEAGNDRGAKGRRKVDA